MGGGYARSEQAYDTEDSDFGLVDICFAIYDLDGDGVPELIANSCYYYTGAKGYVYSYSDSQITFLGNGFYDRSSLYSAPNSAYPGLFEVTDPGPARNGYNEEYDFRYAYSYVITYMNKAGRKLEFENVATEFCDIDFPTVTNRIAINESLYGIYQSEKRRIMLRTIEEINAMGWDTRFAPDFLRFMPRHLHFLLCDNNMMNFLILLLFLS